MHVGTRPTTARRCTSALTPTTGPRQRAHTALEIGDELELVATRLRDAGMEFGDNEFDGRRVLFCQDPAGNRWELRGDDGAPNA